MAVVAQTAWPKQSTGTGGPGIPASPAHCVRRDSIVHAWAALSTHHLSIVYARMDSIVFASPTHRLRMCIIIHTLSALCLSIVHACIANASSTRRLCLVHALPARRLRMDRPQGQSCLPEVDVMQAAHAPAPTCSSSSSSSESARAARLLRLRVEALVSSRGAPPSSTGGCAQVKLCMCVCVNEHVGASACKGVPTRRQGRHHWAACWPLPPGMLLRSCAAHQLCPAGAGGH